MALNLHTALPVSNVFAVYRHISGGVVTHRIRPVVLFEVFTDGSAATVAETVVKPVVWDLALRQFVDPTLEVEFIGLAKSNRFEAHYPATEDDLKYAAGLLGTELSQKDLTGLIDNSAAKVLSDMVADKKVVDYLILKAVPLP